jgi:hypothetical protein
MSQIVIELLETLWKLVMETEVKHGKYPSRSPKSIGSLVLCLCKGRRSTVIPFDRDKRQGNG